MRLFSQWRRRFIRRSSDHALQTLLMFMKAPGLQDRINTSWMPSAEPAQARAMHLTLSKGYFYASKQFILWSPRVLLIYPLRVDSVCKTAREKNWILEEWSWCPGDKQSIGFSSKLWRAVRVFYSRSCKSRSQQQRAELFNRSEGEIRHSAPGEYTF